MKDTAKDQALQDWRREHWKTIAEANRTILEGIRDNPEAKDRDKIEAAKALARLADCLSPEKVANTRNQVGGTTEAPGVVALTEAEERKLQAVLNDIDSIPTLPV